MSRMSYEWTIDLA